MVNIVAVISPAKTLDFETPAPILNTTDFRFGDEAQALIEILKGKSVADIKKLMKLSDALAELNVNRFQSWLPDMTDENSKSSLFAFKGDVYTGLSAETLTEGQIHAAQDSLRILSGLYGLLRPLDKIQPYRLEMGTRLEHQAGQNLYSYWGQKITELFNEDLSELDADYVLNLASQEYFKAVQAKSLNVPVITPNFKDEKNGEYKIISFFAKKARGLMVRYLLDHQITSLDDLKKFNYAGYQYSESESSEFEWIFTRPEQAQK